jgi:hypothetical protein
MSELERMAAVKDEAQNLGDFLHWLESKYRLINKREAFENGYVPFGYSSPINYEELLAEYFGIDLNQCEKEKQEILKSLRK